VKRQPDFRRWVMKNIYIFIVNIVLATFIAGTVYANTTYVIKKGDNPSNLAKRYNVSPQEIIKTNRLKADSLKPGTRITIPSKKKETSSKNRIAKAKERKLKNGKTIKNAQDDARTVSHQEEASIHVVRNGDTLLSISKRYSVSSNELREMNNLRTKKLKVGQKLVVKQAAPKDYTVKRGDTVWNIAKRFNLDPDELKDINCLETDSLKPNQRILLAEETETKELKTYDAILSQAHIEKEIENISGSKEISELVLQDRLTLFAKKLLNIPYRFGGNSLFGIDCSAYVKKVYSLIGVDLPRSAREQFHEGMSVEGEQLSIGDLVFFRTYASFPSHVGIYLGNNLFIHASSRSKKVTIDSLDTPYYLKRFIGAKRLLDVKEVKEDPEKEG
jgi:peptidoglycan DL-endopeptidase LytE